MPKVMRAGMKSYFTASATLDCGLKNEYQPLTAMVWQQKFQLLPTIADFLLIVPFFIPPPRASRLRCAPAVATAGDMVCAPLGVMVGGAGFNNRRGGNEGKMAVLFKKLSAFRGKSGKVSTGFAILSIFGGVWWRLVETDGVRQKAKSRETCCHKGFCLESWLPGDVAMFSGKRTLVY